MLRSGQFTVVVACPVTGLAMFVALAVAVFGYALQLSNVVVLDTCTEAVAVVARLPNVQFRTLAAIPPAAISGLSTQLMPVPVGSGSTRVTPVAIPAPVFLTVIVKPIDSPAFTEAASAVLVTCNAGHCTVV